MPKYISSKAGAEVFCCKKVWMSEHSLQKAVKKRLLFRTIHHQNRERMCLAARRCECPTKVCKKWVIKGANARLYTSSKAGAEVFGCKKVWMSDHSLQKANKRLEFRTSYHQKRERGCSAARKCEYLTIVCKKRVRKGWNVGPYIIKSGSGGV